MSLNSQRTRHYIRHFGKLVGKTVAKVAYTAAEGDIDEGFGLLFTDGTVAWVISDEEGNAQGYLDIVPKAPKQIKTEVKL